jgi:hypothetical protein
MKTLKNKKQKHLLKIPKDDEKTAVEQSDSKDNN